MQKTVQSTSTCLAPYQTEKHLQRLPNNSIICHKITDFDSTYHSTLFLGCLPKGSLYEEIKSYFVNNFDSKIEVELSFKQNEAKCRGYGAIFSPSEQTTLALLESDHVFKGRRIVVERIKTSQELDNKYHDLQSRKLKVMIHYPPLRTWTHDSFFQHFSKFGKLENAHLKMSPTSYRKRDFLIGNVTFFRQKDALKLWRAGPKDGVANGYLLESTSKTKKYPSIQPNGLCFFKKPNEQVCHTKSSTSGEPSPISQQASINYQEFLSHQKRVPILSGPANHWVPIKSYKQKVLTSQARFSDFNEIEKKPGKTRKALTSKRLSKPCIHPNEVNQEEKTGACFKDSKKKVGRRFKKDLARVKRPFWDMLRRNSWYPRWMRMGPTLDSHNLVFKRAGIQVKSRVINYAVRIERKGFMPE